MEGTGAGGGAVDAAGAEVVPLVVVVNIVVIVVVRILGWARAGFAGGGVSQDGDGGEAALAGGLFGVAEDVAEGGDGKEFGVLKGGLKSRHQALGIGHWWGRRRGWIAGAFRRSRWWNLGRLCGVWGGNLVLARVGR